MDKMKVLQDTQEEVSSGAIVLKIYKVDGNLMVKGTREGPL